MNKDRVNKLSEWITTPEAQRILGVSRQGLHKMLWEQELFHEDEVNYVGEKPLYLLKEKAVYEVRDIRLKVQAIRKSLKGLS